MSIRVAIIGTGLRAAMYVKQLHTLKEYDLVALCDNQIEKAKHYNETVLGGSVPCYADYHQMLKEVDPQLVVVDTTDTTHREIAVDVMRDGRHLLLEKPIATTYEDAVAVHMESKQHETLVRLGFCLRYVPLYDTMLEIVRSGVLGKLVSIEAKEMLGHMHGALFMRRWHRYRKNNGGFLNTKCCHDLDMVNLVADSEPVKVSALGANTFFTPIEGAAERCEDCPRAAECPFYLDKNTLTVADNAIEAICPFNSEKDIIDHQVVNVLYKNGVTASFTVTMASARAGRTMQVFGTEGTLTLDLENNKITVRYLHKPTVTEHTIAPMTGTHGGGDERMLKGLAKLIETGGYCNDTRAGMLSTAIAAAADESMLTGTVVDVPSKLEEAGLK